jgi:hypothetical protein
MGHIRLGRLPKSKSWHGVFEAMGSKDIDPAILAQATSYAARQRLNDLKFDQSVNYCFWFLVRIAIAGRSDDFANSLSVLGFREIKIVSGLDFINQAAQALKRGLNERGQKTIFSQIASDSLLEVLSNNIVERSKSLFGTSIDDIQISCRALSLRSQFGKIAKEYYATFASRIIRYVADKELSNFIGPDSSISSPRQALAFQRSVDRYFIETAKIVEEFAAGWFSKHNWESNNNISEMESSGFTSYALQKIIMDLERESK